MQKKNRRCGNCYNLESVDSMKNLYEEIPVTQRLYLSKNRTSHKHQFTCGFYCINTQCIVKWRLLAISISSLLDLYTLLWILINIVECVRFVRSAPILIQTCYLPHYLKKHGWVNFSWKDPILFVSIIVH